jgi:two-component system LytT family response regulator
MKPRRTLIVDDEPLARTALRELLAAHPEIEIVGEAGSAEEALALYRKLQPDLLFLDVQMPKKDAFALLPDFVPAPDIIFVTAYGCFAVKAFEVNAVDYLMKPILPERLTLALARLEKPAIRKAKPFSKDMPIFLYANREMRVVTAMDITNIHAEHNYSRVHLLTHMPMMVFRRISEWKRLLPPEFFFPVDRSNILNLSLIREIVRHPNLCSEVRFQNSTLKLGLFASRRLRKAIRTLFPSTVCNPPQT